MRLELMKKKKETRVCVVYLQPSSPSIVCPILACSLAIIGEVGGEPIHYQHLGS